MKIVADQNQPLVDEYFGSVASVRKLAPEQIDNKALIDYDADALICRSTVKINENLLKNTKVSYVGTCTIGYDHVDLDYLESNKIGFGSAPGCNANSVAEYIVAAILKIANKYSFNLTKKTIGIVGVGNVGKKVAQKAKALGLNLLLNDPPRQRIEGDVAFCSLSELLENSDFITLHVPLIKSGVDKTLAMVDDEFFKTVKKGAVFINASRGAVASGEAILNALRDGKIREYIIDVYENEPNVSNEIVKNAFIATEHISGHSVDGKINGTKIIFDSFRKHFALDVDINLRDVDNQYMDTICLPKKLSGLDAVEYAIDQCYDIISDSKQFKLEPDHFKELRSNYKTRYEFSHYLIKCKDEAILKILHDLGFGRL